MEEMISGVDRKVSEGERDRQLDCALASSSSPSTLNFFSLSFCPSAHSRNWLKSENTRNILKSREI